MTDQAHDAARGRSGPSLTEPVCVGANEGERVEYLDKLKGQIRDGVYRPDIRDLARSLAAMIVREL
jgi:Anti-sigma-28 factor, FlgM.